MPYQATLAAVREQLAASFRALDERFELPAAARSYRPTPDSWSIDEILEHVTLTSHFLLIVIRQGVAKARKRAARQPLLDGESPLEPIRVIGHPDAFPWIRPEHMEPTRSRTSAEVRATLAQQFDECAALLAQIEHGEGSLHRVRMSVQDLGKLDMYQWLFFLALHAQRHDLEIGRILDAWHRDVPPPEGSPQSE